MAMLAARAATHEEERASADRALIDAAARLAGTVRRVAAYVPMAYEPAGHPNRAALPLALAAALPAGGLLLPILRPDRDLDWVAFDSGLAPGATLRRLYEPTGDRLGVEAISTAELVFVPALAVDLRGVRLGRGGGSYDRALQRVRPSVPVIALLYAGEIVDELPAQAHDRPVSAVLTPAGVTTITASERDPVWTKPPA